MFPHPEDLAPVVLRRLQAVPVADVDMSAITKAELLYGVEIAPRRAQDAAALAASLPYVQGVESGAMPVPASDTRFLILTGASSARRSVRQRNASFDER